MLFNIDRTSQFKAGRSRSNYSWRFIQLEALTSSEHNFIQLVVSMVQKMEKRVVEDAPDHERTGKLNHVTSGIGLTSAV